MRKKKNFTTHDFAVNIAAILRKNPDLETKEIMRQMRERGFLLKKCQIDEIARTWRRKSHNAQRIIEFRTGKKNA